MLHILQATYFIDIDADDMINKYAQENFKARYEN